MSVKTAFRYVDVRNDIEDIKVYLLSENGFKLKAVEFYINKLTCQGGF